MAPPSRHHKCANCTNVGSFLIVLEFEMGFDKTDGELTFAGGLGVICADFYLRQSVQSVVNFCPRGSGFTIFSYIRLNIVVFVCCGPPQYRVDGLPFPGRLCHSFRRSLFSFVAKVCINPVGIIFLVTQVSHLLNIYKSVINI